MFRRPRNLRIYVRNKARYNPESKERNFLFVDITDFAGTTIGDVKEDVRKQTRNALRIDELFLNNQSLADDRSVAHYNLEDKTILETTSNPVWVSCLYIKAAEIKQDQQGNPTDNDVQKWTQKSLPKKYTLIGLLLNSKNEYVRQPPHFPTLDDFVDYLERLNKKGATMHPNYTQKDLRALEREYREGYVGQCDDPLAIFIDNHAVRLGYLDPDDVGQRPVVPNIPPNPGYTGGAQVRPRQAAGHRKQDRVCEDCEEAVAQVYCTDCPEGVVLCRPCSAILHAGATRRRHNLQDIQQAPKSNKPYVPRAFLAPFSILVGLYSALRNGNLSLTEDEIKTCAQPLTDTDLQDKQLGKYVGGFDCMENVLMARGFVKKEAARVPTYALTERGHVLGERLYLFYNTCYSLLQAARLPKVNVPRCDVLSGNRKICLLVDENERDKERLVRYCAQKGIESQVRILPAGDYIWILTPPLDDPTVPYTGRDPHNEQVLPFVVERKSWDDFDNSVNSSRFQRQVNKMLGSGLEHCFYLMEGSMSGSRNNPTQQHQLYLKGMLEKLTVEYGFYVNYTSSWMKSAQWLLWFTGLVTEAHRTGLLVDQCIPYGEYNSRVARQVGAAARVGGDTIRHTHKWTAQLFIDHIFQDSQSERAMLSTVREELGVKRGHKHLLIVEGLEQYNKRRQSTLTRCCEAVHANPDKAREIVEDQIGGMVYNMVHYDVSCYWQLYIQVMACVYVVRTETGPDTNRIQQRFLNGPQGPPPAAGKGTSYSVSRRAKKSPDISTAVLPATHEDESSRRNGHSSDLHIQGLQEHLTIPYPNSSTEEAKYASRGRKKQKIHTLSSVDCSSLEEEPFSRNNMSEHSSRQVRRSTVKDKNNLQDEHHSMSDTYKSTAPFSGEGYCLGSRQQHNAVSTTDGDTDTFDHNFENLDEDQQLKAAIEMSIISASPLGKRKLNVEMANDQHMRQVEGDSDFGQLSEQEQVTMAIELSKKRHCSGHVDSHEDQNESLQLKLAIERSKVENSPAKLCRRTRNSIPPESALINEQNMSEEEQMKILLRRSELEAKHFEDMHSERSDETRVKMAIEMSKAEHNRLKCNRFVDNKHSDKDIDKAAQCSRTENVTDDEQLKMVLRLSEMEARNVPNEDRKSEEESEWSRAIERSKAEQTCRSFVGESNQFHSKQTVKEKVNLGSASLDHQPRPTGHDHQPRPTGHDDNEVIYIDSQSQNLETDLLEDTDSIAVDCDSILTGIQHIGEANEKQLNSSIGNPCRDKDVTHVNVVDIRSKESCIDVDRMIVANGDKIANECLNPDCSELNKEGEFSSCSDIDSEEEIVGPSPQKSSGGNLRLSQGQIPTARRQCDSNSKMSPAFLDNSHNIEHKKLVLKDTSPRITTGNKCGFDFKSSLLYGSDTSDDSDTDVEDNPEGEHTIAGYKSRTAETSRLCIAGHGRKVYGNPGDKCIESTSGSVQADTEEESASRNLYNSRRDNSSIHNFLKMEVDISSDYNDSSQDKIKCDRFSFSSTGDLHENEVKEEFEDMYDDDDNDIDYISSQVEVEEQYSSDSEGIDEEEIKEELSDLNPCNFLDQDSIPSIKGPVSKRYRELKYEAETRHKEKERNTLSTERNFANVANQHVEAENNESSKTVVLDGLIANMLQNEYDKESCRKSRREETVSEIDDEYIARQLDAAWNKETSGLPVTDDTAAEAVDCFTSEIMHKQTIIKETDEEVAKRLHAELNSNADTGITTNTETIVIEDSLSNAHPIVTIGTDISHRDRDSFIDDNIGQLEILQQREREQMNRWQRIMEEDEQLARRLQTMEDEKNEDERKQQKVPLNEPSLTVVSEPSFRTVVAQHKASKEKAVAQMEEYRRLQTERYRGLEAGPSNVGDEATNSRINPSREGLDVRKAGHSINHLNSGRTPHTHVPQRDYCMNSQSNAGFDSKGTPAQPQLPMHLQYSKPSQTAIGDLNAQINHSQVNSSSNISQISQSDNGIPGQSEFVTVGHMSPSSQSQTPKSGNVTCGNCGEKGHNRTWARCTKYHTAEESARREAKLEKQRVQKEERRKQEVETVRMLTEHQRELEQMTSQIQDEMSVIQNRLRQRTSQLESQVTNRVKLMQKVTKRKRNN